jgi:hypothetical protein
MKDDTDVDDELEEDLVDSRRSKFYYATFI